MQRSSIYQTTQNGDSAVIEGKRSFPRFQRETAAIAEELGYV